MVSLILFFGFLIRLISLKQSFWLDEAITGNVVKNLSYQQILSNFSPHDFHPPLYYFFIKCWANIFGYSEVALRMPSIIFSLLIGYIIFLIGKEIKNKSFGMWAMVFFIFNPLSIYYSQEARMYMMTTFFIIFSLFFFLKIKNQNNNLKFKIYLFLFNFFLILSFYTFYGSIFFILTLFFYLIYKKHYKIFLFSFLFFLTSFILITPLLYQQYLNSQLTLAQVKNWSLVLGKANFKNLLLIPVKFSIGRISFYPKWWYYFVAASWTSFLFFKILNIKNKKLKKQPESEKIKIFYYLFFLPLLFGFLASFVTPLLQYFRFLYLLPIFCLLLSFVLNTTILRSIVVFGFLFFSSIYLFNQNFHREDWKSLAKNLPNDIKIFMILSSSDPLKYYRSDLKIFSINDIEKINDKKIIVISYSCEIWGIDYEKKLLKRQYKLKREVDLRGISYYIYEKLSRD